MCAPSETTEEEEKCRRGWRSQGRIWPLRMNGNEAYEIKDNERTTRTSKTQTYGVCVGRADSLMEASKAVAESIRGVLLYGTRRPIPPPEEGLIVCLEESPARILISKQRKK